MIPEVLGRKKLMIRTEIVEGDVLWIICRDWMEERRMVIDVRKMEMKLEKMGKKCNMQSRCP